MYDVLAKHYDSLVKDDEATANYVSFIEKHGAGPRVMELACGSGEISLALAKLGYEITASDLSNSMLMEARQKDQEQLVNYRQMDMTNIDDLNEYDMAICFCDSVNYLTQDEIEVFFTSIYQRLSPQGCFLFDMHSKDRLVEFEEEFYEAGVVDGMEYTWSIVADEDKLYHNFIFYDEQGKPTYENHMQTVFDANAIKKDLEKIGFHVSIYTDFELKGIQPGEKYFFVCRKD